MKKAAIPILVAALWLALGVSPSVAGETETVFIHLTANFKENDGPVCVAFNAAWQALRDGAEVEIFFDQEAAYGLKQWEPGKTDLGLYDLPDRIKQLLQVAFAVKPEALPRNYQEYLAMLHDKGARVSMIDSTELAAEITRLAGIRTMH